MRSLPRLSQALALSALLGCGSLAANGGPPAPSGPPIHAEYGSPVQLWANGGCASWGCQTGWYASPAVVDLHGDGHPKVLWGASDLVALDAVTGALEWRAAGGGRIWPSPAVANLTGSGGLQVAVGRGDGSLTLYSAAGAALWSVVPFGGDEIRTLALADLAGSGQLDILVGRASGGDVEQLAAYDAQGRLRPGWPARRSGEPGNGWGMYNENVAVADLDGDGHPEIIGPTDTHYITALDWQGNQLTVNSIYGTHADGSPKFWSEVGVHVDQAVDLRGWAHCGTEHRPNFAGSAPAIADLDGDGVPEIVVVGNVYDCGTDPYTDLYEMPFLLHADRTRFTGSGFDWTVLPAPAPGSGPRSEDYQRIELSVPNAVVADLDGDGQREVLHASYDGRVHAYWLDRTEHGSWPLTVSGGGLRFASEPVVADLDGDGKAEVIFTSWPEKASGQRGRLHVADYLGREVYAVDLPPSAPAGSWNGGLGAPTLARIDAGDLVVFAGTASSGVVAYRIPGSASGKILWGTGRGNPRRTGTPAP